MSTKFFILRSFTYLMPGRGETQLIGPFDTRAVANSYKSLTENARPRGMRDYVSSSRVVEESKAPSNPTYRLNPNEDTLMEASAIVRQKHTRTLINTSSYTRIMPKGLREDYNVRNAIRAMQINPDTAIIHIVNKDLAKALSDDGRPLATPDEYWFVTSDGGDFHIIINRNSSVWCHNNLPVVVNTIEDYDSYIEEVLGL